MTEVTKDMILDYLVKKGGVVKNVDLVRHFRKYLQVENPLQKDHAREVFKERVNSVASIRAEKGEKYLYLRPEYQAAGRPPSGCTSVAGSERASVSSIDTTDPRNSLQSRDSLTQLISDLLSPTATATTSDSHFTDFGSVPAPAQNSSSYSSTGRGSTSSSSSNMFTSPSRNKNDAVLQSYKPLSTSSATSATPSYQSGSTGPTSSTMYSSSSMIKTNGTSSSSAAAASASTVAPSSSSLFSPTTTTSSGGLGDMGLGSLGGDLMSSFGDLFSSFGTGSSTTTATTGTGGSGGLGGLGMTSSSTTTSEGASLSKLFDSPAASKSTPSYSSSTATSSTAAPQVSTSGQTPSQRSPRRAPPEAPVNKTTPPPPSLNQTSPSRTSLGGTTSSSLQGSPRRPPPGPPPVSSSGANSKRASTVSASSLGGVASSSSRRQSSGSATSSSSLQGSPRRPPPGPPGVATTGGPPSAATTSNNAAVNSNNSRRAPPPVPSPKTSTLSMGGGSTTSPSRNYGSNLDPSRKSSYDPQSSPGRTTSSHYANYGSPYHQHQQQQGRSHSSVTPPTRVMSPPRGSSQSTNKMTSPPLGGTSVESPRTNSSVGSSSIGGVGSFDLGDLTSTISTMGGGMSSFLDTSLKSEPPKATSSPSSSAAAYSSGPSTSSNFNAPSTVSSGPSASQYAPLSTAYSRSSGPSTNSGPSGSNYPLSSEYSLLGASSRSPTSTGPPTSKHNAPSSEYSLLGASSSSPTGPSEYSLLGPSGITSSSSQQPPGPSMSAPSGRAGGVEDGSGQRRGFFDRTSRHHGSSDALREQTPPTIRVHTSPPPDSLRRRDSRSRSPTYSTLGPPLDGLDSRLRPQTGDSVTSSLVSSLGVQLRNKEGKQRSSQGPSVRRSRNMDKNANLDSVTRMSISMVTTPPSSRRNKPEVAPKPSPKPAHRGGLHSFITRSREDLRQDAGDDGSLTEMSEQDSWEIDPLEKDWMLASAQADLQGLQQLLMEEQNLVNRKDFIHGYTALHWAAKHGRCDIIAGLMLNGAQVDIKSNGGLTPLHLAAQSGYDNAIEQLISDFGADPNVRDYGGRRPVDILSNKASERARSLLCQINNHGLPTRVHTSDHLLTFSQPHTKNSGGLNRNWSSLGDMVDKRIDREKHKKIPRMTSIRKSFSISKKKDYSPSKKEKRRASAARPVSDAVSYAYNV